MSDRIKVPLQDVTFDQLKWFCEHVQGITVHPFTKKTETLMSKLQATYFKDYIEVPPNIDAEAPVADETEVSSEEPVGRPVEGSEAYWNEKVKITITKLE